MALTASVLKEWNKLALMEKAAELHIKGAAKLNKPELIDEIIKADRAAERKRKQKKEKKHREEESVPVEEPESVPAPSPAPAAPRATPAVSERVTQIVADIRSAHLSGARMAQISESDDAIVNAVLAQLSKDEQRRVCFGSSGNSSAIG